MNVGESGSPRIYEIGRVRVCKMEYPSRLHVVLLFPHPLEHPHARRVVRRGNEEGAETVFDLGLERERERL